MDFLIFNLGGVERYAIDVLGVREIMKPCQLHMIPGSHSNILGCIDVRGCTVPVMNLRGVLFSESAAVSEMLIVLDRDEPMAFSTGSVDQIMKLGHTEMRDLQRNFSGRFLEGVFKACDGSLIQVLNVDAIAKTI